MVFVHIQYKEVLLMIFPLWQPCVFLLLTVHIVWNSFVLLSFILNVPHFITSLTMFCKPHAFQNRKVSPSSQLNSQFFSINFFFYARIKRYGCATCVRKIVEETTKSEYLLSIFFSFLDCLVINNYWKNDQNLLLMII